MTGETTAITRETPIKTNLGVIVGIIGATALAVGSTLVTYFSLKGEIALVRIAVEPVQEMKSKIDQLWWEHHSASASAAITKTKANP